MSYRIEEKIPLSLFEGISLIDSLKPKGLKVLFPKRKINSVYYDTPLLTMFRDSEEGLLPRKKIRVRNYPESSNNESSLEKKISSVEGRYKVTAALDVLATKKINKNGYFDNTYGHLIPLVQVSYDREYYEYNGLRITLDSDIIYQDVIEKTNQYKEKMSVVELKAGPHWAPDAIIALIQENRRRFSKYCNAIRYLNLS